MKAEIEKFRKELEEEVRNILDYWMEHVTDQDNGGFYGKIDNDNKVYPAAAKGSVLNSRILWSFSAAYTHTAKKEYLEFAKRAFGYIVQHFIDKEFGGVYWSVDANGQPLDTRKQIYALAFALYGLSEYALATNSITAKKYSLELYKTIEQYSHDNNKGGYLEALSRDWQEISDLRLSAKDANEKKTMNTHLHVLEAYANLYRIWPDDELYQNIQELIRLFLKNMIHAQTNHLALFFDEDWKVRSETISYGHDIEAAWLVLEAAEIIGDTDLIKKIKERSGKIAQAACEGLDEDGGLCYEYKAAEQILVKEKHWWVQAEAMVGFFNTWQLTGDESYFFYSFNTWQFVKKNILDKEKGEWIWGVNEDRSPMLGEDKVGIWKCPYHNTRACLEIISRINKMEVASIKKETPFFI